MRSQRSTYPRRVRSVRRSVCPGMLDGGELRADSRCVCRRSCDAPLAQERSEITQSLLVRTTNWMSPAQSQSTTKHAVPGPSTQFLGGEGGAFDKGACGESVAGLSVHSSPARQLSPRRTPGHAAMNDLEPAHGPRVGLGGSNCGRIVAHGAE